MLAARALVLLLAASPPSTEAPVTRDTPVRCDEEKATCRDGCSLDYGTSVDTRKQLGTCLDRCDERQEICLLRVVAKQASSPPAPAQKDAREPAKRPGLSTPYTLPPTEYSDTPTRPDATPPDEVPPLPRTSTSARQLDDEPRPPPADAAPSAPAKADTATSPPSSSGAKTPAPTKKKKKGKSHKDSDSP